MLFHRNFANKFVEMIHLYRTHKIKKIVESWQSKKNLPINLRWVVGDYGAWLELIHDIKENAVYTDFANQRGFSADSDYSPIKNFMSPTIKNQNCQKKTEQNSLIKVHKDSWSGISNTLKSPENTFNSLGLDKNPTPRQGFQLIKPIKCQDFWDKDDISAITENEKSDSICSIPKQEPEESGLQMTINSLYISKSKKENISKKKFKNDNYPKSATFVKKNSLFAEKKIFIDEYDIYVKI